MTKLIYLASDHGGVDLKDHLAKYLETKGYTVKDLGTNGKESVDYPDFANEMAEALKDEPDAFGLLICGSGIGISIAANRHSHIRAALVNEETSAKLARQHNNANVLCLGGRLSGSTLSEACVDAFLSTPFEGGRHERRVEKLSKTSSSSNAESNA